MARRAAALLGLLLLSGLMACTRMASSDGALLPQGNGQPSSSAAQAQPPAAGTATRTPFLPPTRVPGAPILSPTPDAARILPTPRTTPDEYVAQAGDSLGSIAERYGISLDELVKANQIDNPNQLYVGQNLVIPPPTPQSPGSDFKIIPDSELVYGPASVSLDLQAFISEKKGYLAQYSDVVNAETLSGAQVVQLVSEEYSVNPRLLLAVLEFRSGWVTNPSPEAAFNDFPLGYRNDNYKGLYLQLSWAANNLNRGFYLWGVNAISSWVLADGSVTPVAPTINAGTAGVQNLMAQFYGRADWDKAVSQDGLFATYSSLFGYPFDLAIEPLVPPDLKQPLFQLPFERGVQWSFTGGPHGGWGEGSAWAALDFAPPGDALGCVSSDAWVVAVADGLIVRAKTGEVMEDLDGDGYEQTGWDVLYMHVDTRERVAPGTYVHAGDHIGHPSCEGGVSNGTHVHLARRYNGEWIAADGALPFNLDGWISSGTGTEYDGFLKRDGQSIEAWDGRKAENQIQR